MAAVNGSGLRASVIAVPFPDKKIVHRADVVKLFICDCPCAVLRGPCFVCLHDRLPRKIMSNTAVFRRVCEINNSGIIVSVRSEAWNNSPST